MTTQATLIRNYLSPPNAWDELLILHEGKVHTASPGLLQVFGAFLDDGTAGAIAAAMSVEGTYGYVSTTGKWIVAPTLEYAFPFSEGLSHFCEGGLWGYRGRDGKVIVPARFLRVEPFRYGYAAVQVKGGKWRYIDSSGAFAFDASFGLAKSFSAVGLAAARGTSAKYGYIDRSGAWAIAPRFQLPFAFSDAGVAPAAEKPKQYGLINQHGEWVLAPCFEAIREFNDDKLAFCSERYNHDGYLDSNGVLLIRDMDRLSQHMQCGIAVDANRSCMTAQGELAFDRPLDWCDDFNEYGFAVARSDANSAAPAWGIARADGTFATPPAGVLEPVTVRDSRIAPCEAATPLLAFLEQDHGVVLLDRDARIVYRLRAVTGQQGSSSALYDAAGCLLWQGAAFPALRSPRRFFSAPPDSLLAELPGFDALGGLADALVRASEDKLHRIGALLEAIGNGEYDAEAEATYDKGHDDSAQDDDELDLEDQLAQALRSRRRIFRSYLDEDEHGRYPFLFEERIVMARALHARFAACLADRFGAPERDPDYAGQAAPEDTSAWRIALAQPVAGAESGHLWLGLSSVLETGDGDAWNHIWLVCAPSKETLEAALAGHAPLSLAHDADPAPEALTDWLARVSASPETIVTMPAHLIDEAIADAAIDADIRAYPFLPARLQTRARLEALIRRGADTASAIAPVAMTADGLALARSLYADDARWRRADTRNSTVPTTFHSDCLEHVWGCLLDQQTCLNAVFNDAPIRHVPCWLHSEDIIEIALADDPENIRFVAPCAITPRVAAFMASRGKASLLERIPPALLTAEMRAQMVQEEVQEEVQEGEAASSGVADKDDDTLLRELASRPRMLATIPGRRITRQMVELAVGLDQEAVRFVPRRLMTTALYELAFREGHKCFEQLPPAVMSEAFCLAAVETSGYQLRLVPPELRTLALCIASVCARSWMIDDVPAPLRDAVVRAIAKLS